MPTDLSPSTMTPAVADDLDRLGVGTFRLDRNGYLIQFNRTAGLLLGVSDDTSRKNCSIFRIDQVLGLGLAAELDNLIATGDTFERRDVTCTNLNGRFQVLNLISRVETGDSGEPEVVGLIQDIRSAAAADSPHSFLQERLNTLAQVSEALTSSQDLPQILKVILTGATADQGLGFNRCFLYLYNEENESLDGHLAIGPSSAEEAGTIWHQLESQRLSLEQLLHDESTQSGAQPDRITELISDHTVSLTDPSLLADLCGEHRWANLDSEVDIDPVTAAFLDRLGTRRSALVPMINKGRLQGLLVADNAITSRPIANDDVQMLQTLANHAAVAMERARLYESQYERACELERANSLLAESQEQVIKIEKMSIIGELTSAVAHELRNPLTIIGGFANLMLKESVSDGQREYLNIIASETRRTETVLSQLLEFHRDSKSENRVVDFSDLVERNLQLVKGRLNRPDLQISLSAVDGSLPVFGNPDQLAHALYQLFHLIADDLIPPGRAEARMERTDGQARLRIRIVCPDDARERLTRSLQQIFSDHRASQRLSILVAGETIRYHGGTFGCAYGTDGLPSLYMELPLHGEEQHG